MSTTLPSSSSSSSSLFPESRTVKERQISHLAQQLTVLASRAEQLERLTLTTADQASHMRLLGGFHAGWFMAAGRVMTPGDTPPPPPPAPADDGGNTQ